MAEIKFDYTLYSDQAEALAKELADDFRSSRKANKRSQLRKFYDEVLRLDTEAKVMQKDKFEERILLRLNLLIAKAAYAQGRELVSPSFVKFIKDWIDQVNKDHGKMKYFTTFFEAVMGFYRLYGPAS